MRTYQLIRLRRATVEDLKRLKIEMGKSTLDDLITSMILLVDEHRQDAKNLGWDLSPSRWDGEG